MQEQAAQIQAEALAAIEAATTEAILEDARVKFLGKKSPLNALAGEMRNLSNEEKPKLGAALNAARQAIGGSLETQKQSLQDAADAASVADLDASLPARTLPSGALHPLTVVKDRAIQILRRLGFALADGPEIETEFHCFDALNTPFDHPARNDSDTFYFDSGKLLRTHTSSVQIRTMEKVAPPIKIIAPGSAYRRDEIDATHLSVFNQLEGLYVDKDVRLSDLKGTLEFFYRAMFGENTEVRFRPHFFPFTEPSFEIDVKLQVKGEAPKWIEVAGCGMVDPAVFTQVNESRGDQAFDPAQLTGYAFGMGLDRLAMIQYGIRDIRLLIENDTRFLSQFA
ncbi:MAG: phenylalanine--tRNA ligase subunit alpha [Akkermansiaceae bacterium]|jgi:phenylalanyl-tRNA synthetase alpha chain|nr:phenylalanine--tRNA ligase subunit alpha [Akkermansiaceae bacterium]